MSDLDIAVPDLGNFDEVSVVDVLVKAGDAVEVDTPLVTLETEKATMDVPSTAAGKVTAVLVKAGDKVRKGSVIVRMAGVAAAPASAPQTAAPAAPSTPGVSPAPVSTAGTAATAATHAPAAAPAAPAMPPGPKPDRTVQLVVLGGGPGGYSAAFRAADLGMQVLLIERWNTLGGVCLKVGCIPSKALLHAAKVIDEAKAMSGHGVSFGAPQIDLDKLRDWKNSVIRKLTGGLTGLAKTRKVEVVRGYGKFAGSRVIEVAAEDGTRQLIGFEHCIIAAGSEPVKLPFMPQDPRIIDSTGALELQDVPQRLLVVGGGIIGLEMACVYDALGSKVSVVELGAQLMPGADPDLVKPLEKRVKARYEQILLGTKSTKAEALPEGIRVSFDASGTASTAVYDRVLVAVGRVPNGRLLNAEAAGITVNERGFIPVDNQMRTNVPGIFAIGDIVGQPMLAHKASHEAKVAAEVAAGHKAFFDARVIPSVAYTDPEVAWVGVTEGQAKQDGLNIRKASFPWAASGRSLSLGRDEGFTKLIVDAATNRVIGAGIVGPNAGELISEVALAIELGADAADVGLTIHPHPTLSESVGMAAEALEGTLTDLYMPRKG